MSEQTQTDRQISGESHNFPRRVLDTYDRVSEVLFGLIMVLTFTGSLHVANAGRDDVRTMLIGAVGCNLAWGIIDAILYLMSCLAERGQSLTTLRAVRAATDPGRAERLVAAALPSVVASVLTPSELSQLRRRLAELPEPAKHARLGKDDWLGAIGVFLLVFFATFPVVIPFLVIAHAPTALRVSNLIAIVLLFVTGYVFGRVAGRQPFLVGLSMVFVGAALVTLTIALGG